MAYIGIIVARAHGEDQCIAWLRNAVWDRLTDRQAMELMWAAHEVFNNVRLRGIDIQ